MIDWFASKISIIIFILVVGSALLYFTGMQNDIYSNSIRTQQANDVARIVDNLCEGCSFTYDFGVEREVVGTGNEIYVDGIKRTVIPNVDGNIKGNKAVIVNEGGKVKIK